MKRLLFSTLAFVTLAACGQADKSKRPSPPAQATATISSGATITIDYSQPAVKGRKIGENLEPMPGKVWRTGANEATVFEISKDVSVEGKSLAAGKYGLYSIMNGDDWTIIFNKKWDQWGTRYNEADDALRVNVKSSEADSFAERLTFTVAESGKVSLAWGDRLVSFNVK